MPCGEKTKSVLIGRGAIAFVPNQKSNSPHPLYHFGRSCDLAADLPTFSIWDKLTIGAILVQEFCLLDPAKRRKSSEPYLDVLGTCDDYWNLAEQ
jgi:hypothetical protein